MYIPAPFEISDVSFCYEVIQEYSFAQMISCGEGAEPFVTHLPLLLDENRGPMGTLFGHVARANPHGHSLVQCPSVLTIFAGPQAYVSPTWYVHSPAVPTWNYLVVHAYGVAHLLGEADTRAVLDQLTEKYEGTGPDAWRLRDQSSEFQKKMANGIVAFAIEITRLQAKAKLSQNRAPEDSEGVQRALRASPRAADHDVAQWMHRMRTKA